MRALILIAALALASCGSEHIAKPSDAYLVCAAEPDPPAGSAGVPVTDEQDAQYKRDLRDAGQDCRSKLQYVHDWVHKLP